MIDNVSFSLDGWDEYTSWQTEDKRIIKKINALIRDIVRNGHSGIGHPEPLKHNLDGYWSRKINEKNRLIYRIFDDGKIEIIHCRGHYQGK